MRAVFRYPGAKWRLSEWIIEHFPEDYEKLVYLEPFLGSGAVFFNKLPGAVETINDLDGDIYNLFWVLRERPEELKQKIKLTPYSREEYDNSFLPSSEPVEKARRFMVRTTQAIGAKMDGKCGWRNHKQKKIGGTPCKWAGIADNIDIASKRLLGDTTHLVQIERTDALKLIEKYNNPEVLMYLDPPYLRDTRHSNRLYQHELSDDAHKRLLQLIIESKAKIVLSSYDSELYSQALKGWYKFTTETRTTSSEVVVECIWTNYEPPCKQITFFEESE